jgi:hypothetical protein
LTVLDLALTIKEGLPMPSLALETWRTKRTASLDEIENLYDLAGTAGPRSRSTTQQLKQAFTLLLSAEFQGFCRDLHTECARAVARVLPSTDLQKVMAKGLLLERRLNTGNANAGNIGADFNRFDMAFWTLVDAAHPRNPRRKVLLEQMNRWRNAIAHNTFDPGMLKSDWLVLSWGEVRRWRKACNGLARWFDQVMQTRLRTITGTNPW